VAAASGAGLTTGLARFRDPGIVIAVLVLIAVLISGTARIAAGAAALAVALGGGAARRAMESCAARLPLGEASYVVHAVDPAEGQGRVELIGARCAGTVVAVWPRDKSREAGVTASVHGRWVPMPRSLGPPDGRLLIGSVGRVLFAPTRAERWRSAIVHDARRYFGARAPMVEALVAGWRSEVDPALKAAFASSGLLHLLAISGWRVTWLASMAWLFLRLARLGRHSSAIIAAAIAVGYVAFIGAPAGALRAGIALGVVAISRARQRSVQLAAVVAVAWLVTIAIDPWSAVAPAPWLSIAGLAGVVLAVRWSDRAIGTSWFVRAVAASVGALLATAPLAAAVFGQVAPIGVLLNLIGAPLMLLAVPAVFGTLLCAGMPLVANGLAASGNLLLAAVEQLARIGAGAPGSAPVANGDWQQVAFWSVLLLAALWITHGPSTLPEAIRRTAWTAASTVCALALLPTPRVTVGADHRLTLLFLDVGQGDAALIRTPAGHWIEVDAGPVGEGRDAGVRVVVPTLRRERVARIDLFVLSHAHRDHVGGAASVAAAVPVSEALDPGELFADSVYEAWLAALPADHVRWHPARAGLAFTLDSVHFQVLHPPTVWPHEGEDLNEDSLVLEVTYGGFRALLMGDAGFVAEPTIGPEAGMVNVLKVGHHGSAHASSAAFLAQVRPQVAVVSVGRNNYGHPAPETLARLVAADAQVWRTDQQGTVRVSTDGRQYTVIGARGAATFGVSH
jgi:competence protein ComEC